MPRSYIVYNPLPEISMIPLEGHDIGFLGGLDPIKGFDILVKAWLKIYRRYSHIRLNAAMAMNLPSWIEKLNVHRLPRLNRLQLNEFYKKCKAIVIPSKSPEPSPYVAIEALLRGRLLIASEIGGIPRIVKGAPGVRLVPPGDTDTLARVLEWAISMDKVEALELGLKNHEYILKTFNNKRSIHELIKVFENVL